VEIDLFDEPKAGPGLAAEMGKTFLLSAVAVVGSFAGLVVVTAAMKWGTRRSEKRKEAEKAPEE
jgi:hypothetical protein